MVRTMIASAPAAATPRHTSCGKNSAPSLFFQPGGGKKGVRIKVEKGGRESRCPEASRRFRDGTTDVHLETLRLLGYTDDTPSCFLILWTSFKGGVAAAR